MASFSVYADTSGETPVWLRYSLRFASSENRCIFRYDMAPHHQTSSPDHKHVGQTETVVESGKFDLRSALREVRQYLAR